MPDAKVDAPLVFEGSVKSLATSNVAAVPAGKGTAVVVVDRVRHAPRALLGLTGQEITLRMAPGEKLSAGDKALFFAESLLFAEHLAVQSRGHDPVGGPMAAMAAVAAAGPMARHLRSRIDQAQAVVSGRVTEVRPLAAAAARRATFAAAPAGRISEHDPLWHEAVVDVSKVHKGVKRQKVVVRFPASTDVRWYKAPKFTKGQTGLWCLHAEPPKRGMAMAVAGKPAAAVTFTALDPHDFHPSSVAPVLAAMLPGPAATPAKGKARTARITRKSSGRGATATKPVSGSRVAKRTRTAKARPKRRS